jgi:hypothetical protein
VHTDIFFIGLSTWLRKHGADTGGGRGNAGVEEEGSRDNTGVEPTLGSRIWLRQREAEMAEATSFWRSYDSI